MYFTLPKPIKILRKLYFKKYRSCYFIRDINYKEVSEKIKHILIDIEELDFYIVTETGHREKYDYYDVDYDSQDSLEYETADSLICSIQGEREIDINKY